MYQSMKCEPPKSPTERRKLNISSPTETNSNTAASAGILITSTPAYKPPEAQNNWKAEIKVLLALWKAFLLLICICRGFGTSQWSNSPLALIYLVWLTVYLWKTWRMWKLPLPAPHRHQLMVLLPLKVIFFVSHIFPGVLRCICFYRQKTQITVQYGYNLLKIF